MPAFFHNVLFMLVLMLGMGLGFAPAVYAETAPAKVEAHNPQHNQAVAPSATLAEVAPVSTELLEKPQDRLIELEKETAVLKAELGARIDGQDNYISNGLAQHGAQVTLLSNQTTHLGNLIQWFAMGIAVLGLVGGFFAFLRAEKLAKKRIDEWFESNETALQERIENLGHVAVDALNSRAEEIKELMEQTRQGVHDRAVDIYRGLEQVEAAMLKVEKPSAQVEQDARDLNLKPRTEWTADDFYNAGVYSYTSGDYEVALNRWDAVINMLADSPEPALRERAAKALLKKGITLRRMNRPEQEARAVFEELFSRFGDSTEPGLLRLFDEIRKALDGKS